MDSIGLLRRQALGILQQFGLAPFRNILTADELSAVAASSSCTPLRRRALTPEVVVWLMVGVALETASMTQGLVLAWGWISSACWWLKGSCVTEEAFCLARERLPLRFWYKLWDLLRAKYESRFDAVMRWKGLRPLAVDGTEVDAPNMPALVKFFTRPKTKHGESKSPQGRLVAACSVFTGFCLHFEFISRRFSEQLALQHLIRKFRQDDLIILDRGFFSLRHHALHFTAQGPFPPADSCVCSTLASSCYNARPRGLARRVPSLRGQSV